MDYQSVAIWRSMGSMYNFSLTFLISEEQNSLSLKQTLPEFGSLLILLFSDSTSIITHKYSFILMHLQSHTLFFIHWATNNFNFKILVTIYNACIYFCSVLNFLTCDRWPLSVLNIICSGPYLYHCSKISLALYYSQFLFENNIW